eukprot:6719100-Prymnesium_polylepis.1
MNRSRWSGASLLAAQSAASFGTLLFPKVVFRCPFAFLHATVDRTIVHREISTAGQNVEHTFSIARTHVLHEPESTSVPGRCQALSHEPRATTPGFVSSQ